MASSIASSSVNVRRAPAVKAPPWLLLPIGLGLVRLSVYPGELWWLLGAVALLLDVATLYVLLRLAGRFPLGSRRPLRHLGPYAVAATVFVAASLALQSAIIARDPARPPDETVLHSVLGELFRFLVWSGVAHGIMYLRRYRAEEAHALRLRLELASVARTRAEAELRSFEAELNPRFLIGALRSAAKHAESDPARSEQLLVEIGDVVRTARPVSHAPTLGDEIAALGPFVALEQGRLNQEIVLRPRIEDELLDAPVPHLVLAVLVREALRATSGGGAITIDISAARSANGEHLHVDVSCARQRPAVSKTGREDDVLARTADHLRDTFAGDAAIEVSRTENGARVRLTVPLDREEPEAGSDVQTEDDHPADDVVPATQPARRSARVVPVLLAVWFIVLSALNVNTALTRPRSNGLIAPPELAIPEGLLAAACITLILYVAIRLTRRGLGPRMWGIHALAAVGVGLLNSMSKWLFVTVAGHPYPPHSFGDVVRRTIGGMTVYAIFAGIIGAFEYARRHRSAEEKSLRLRADLAEAERRRVEAELRALKAELNPHFLGNALVSASSVMHTDPAAARDMLTRLADVVGAAVARVGTQEVTLQEEIDGLASFIAVEQSRFGDRLAVHWEIDEDARTARVPHLILQPLVENAVKHGLAPRGGRIVVGGHRDGQRLELTVRDDGVGLEQARRATHVRRGGVGLSNSRARLEQLYGDGATLKLEPAPEAGTIVRLTLPWR